LIIDPFIFRSLVYFQAKLLSSSGIIIFGFLKHVDWELKYIEDLKASLLEM